MKSKYERTIRVMKVATMGAGALALTALFTGCQPPEEQEPMTPPPAPEEEPLEPPQN